MFCRSCGKEIDETVGVCPQCGIGPLQGNKFCSSCGVETKLDAEFCVKCGAKLAKADVEEVPEKPEPVAVSEVSEKPIPEAGAAEVSEKSRLAATLLAFFLGQFGIHRFYLGKVGTAAVMLILGILGWATVWFGVGAIFLVVVGVWALVDFIFAVAGLTKDKEGRPIKNW